MLSDRQLLKLQEIAVKMREQIIEMLVTAGSGHSAGPLGMADIFTAFYFYILRHDPRNPDWDERDRLILSNGHICPVRYAAMAMAGYFPLEELQTLRKINSRLQGHPHRSVLPGLETTSGPLGEGLSQAIGMALAARLDNKKHTIFCITSDGEHQEGNTWEAIMLAGKLKLDNLINVIDYNNIQIDGFVTDVMPEEPMKAKYEAFNWEVLEVDGNNIRAFIETIEEAKAVHAKPTIVICHTIPGKGVDFMENNPYWHGSPPDLQDVKGAPPKGEQAKKALAELRTLQGKIESEHEG
ncbi:MAG TPA: transketolase [Patescibacteria group bacterium]|nr:transketolase [Patescibacteria group bacterium]